jgi:hypothetical protein
MPRQACRVDSLCDHSMLKKLILFVGRLLRARSREASEEAKFAVHSNAGVELLRLRDKVAALR